MENVISRERLPLPALLLAAASLAFIALAVACDGDDSSPATPTATGQPTDSPTPTAAPTTPVTTPSPSPTSPTPTASPTPVPFDGTRDPVETQGTAPAALLISVRTGLHPTFDRIVFEFQDNVPGYRIEYVEPPILQDGSGLPALVEAEQTGDFEAHLTWVLGLTEQTEFRVRKLTDPFRVAIDVKHP